LNSVAAWDAGYARYHSADEQIRAVITWIDASRDDARAADERAAAGSALGPLDGLLVGLKDNIDVAGVRTTAGARFLTDNIASKDATVVRILRRHGAVIPAKLNMAELAWGATTQNATFGSCRNPWDLSLIPGGSSGGSGAAIAAGYCDAALGTDTGASVRIPAAVNGVVGLRPSFGTISNHGVYPVAYTLDAVGPMARRAVDAALLTEALTAFDAADPYSVTTQGAPAASLLDKPLDGIRVGVARPFFFDQLEDGVGTVVEEFLTWLAAARTRMVPVPDFGAAHAQEHWTRIVQCEGAAFHQQRIQSSPDDFSPDVRARIMAGFDIRGTDLARSQDFRARYRRRLDVCFDDTDIIVTPVVPIDVPPIGGYDSREVTAALGRITYPWALHDGPTLSLPIGFHPRSGNPVGIALSSRRFNEAVVFQVAAAYQRVTKWHTRQAAAVAR
jgi:aspartyl-tRNA(Asn)/glutamyl-tRNA(Gln) amidotransferase subunit A